MVKINKTENELIILRKELAVQKEEKEKLAAELTIALKELAFQTEEKEKRVVELSIASFSFSSFWEASSLLALMCSCVFFLLSIRCLHKVVLFLKSRFTSLYMNCV